jgi:hypothetical protein
MEVGVVIRTGFERLSETPLGRWVADRLDVQVERSARSFFAEPYRSKRHREAFRQVLAALVKERDGAASRLGRRLRLLLDASDSPMAAALEQHDHQVARDARWLKAFFDDEPDWRGRLSAWLRVPER